MKILVLAIGKPKSRTIEELVKGYSKRLVHYLPFEIEACKDEKQALSKIDPQDFFIVLDERGAEFSSKKLAELIAKHQGVGTKRMIFLIGGPDGISESLRKKAKLIFSLSKLTFPHELVQVIVTEQLYRACSILKGEPYHRE